MEDIARESFAAKALHSRAVKCCSAECRWKAWLRWKLPKHMASFDAIVFAAADPQEGACTVMPLLAFSWLQVDGSDNIEMRVQQ